MFNIYRNNNLLKSEIRNYQFETKSRKSEERVWFI